MSYVNDNFSDALLLSGVSGVITPFHYGGVDGAATSEPGEYIPRVGETLWWTWVCPTAGFYFFSTENSSSDGGESSGLDTYLVVFANNSNQSNISAENDDVGGNGFYYNSRVEFTAVAGTTYYIQVSQYSANQGGTIRLAWGMSIPPAPPAVIAVTPSGTRFAGNSVFTAHVVASNLSTNVGLSISSGSSVVSISGVTYTPGNVVNIITPSGSLDIIITFITPKLINQTFVYYYIGAINPSGQSTSGNFNVTVDASQTNTTAGEWWTVPASATSYLDGVHNFGLRNLEANHSRRRVWPYTDLPPDEQSQTVINPIAIAGWQAYQPFLSPADLTEEWQAWHEVNGLDIYRQADQFLNSTNAYIYSISPPDTLKPAGGVSYRLEFEDIPQILTVTLVLRYESGAYFIADDGIAYPGGVKPTDPFYIRAAPSNAISSDGAPGRAYDNIVGPSEITKYLPAGAGYWYHNIVFLYNDLLNLPANHGYQVYGSRQIISDPPPDQPPWPGYGVRKVLYGSGSLTIQIKAPRVRWVSTYFVDICCDPPVQGPPEVLRPIESMRPVNGLTFATAGKGSQLLTLPSVVPDGYTTTVDANGQRALIPGVGVYNTGSIDHTVEFTINNAGTSMYFEIGVDPNVFGSGFSGFFRWFPVEGGRYPISYGYPAGICFLSYNDKGFLYNNGDHISIRRFGPYCEIYVNNVIKSTCVFPADASQGILGRVGTYVRMVRDQFVDYNNPYEPAYNFYSSSYPEVPAGARLTTVSNVQVFATTTIFRGISEGFALDPPPVDTTSSYYSSAGYDDYGIFGSVRNDGYYQGRTMRHNRMAYFIDKNKFSRIVSRFSDPANHWLYEPAAVLAYKQAHPQDQSVTFSYTSSVATVEFLGMRIEKLVMPRVGIETYPSNQDVTVQLIRIPNPNYGLNQFGPMTYPGKDPAMFAPAIGAPLATITFPSGAESYPTPIAITVDETWFDSNGIMTVALTTSETENGIMLSNYYDRQPIQAQVAGALSNYGLATYPSYIMCHVCIKKLEIAMRQRHRDDGLATDQREQKGHGSSQQLSIRRGGRTYY